MELPVGQNARVPGRRVLRIQQSGRCGDDSRPARTGGTAEAGAAVRRQASGRGKAAGTAAAAASTAITTSATGRRGARTGEQGGEGQCKTLAAMAFSKGLRCPAGAVDT